MTLTPLAVSRFCSSAWKVADGAGIVELQRPGWGTTGGEFISRRCPSLGLRPARGGDTSSLVAPTPEWTSVTLFELLYWTQISLASSTPTGPPPTTTIFLAASI